MSFFGFLKKMLAPGVSYVSVDTERKVKTEWQRIAVLLRGKSPSQLRQALIMADRTLDASLKDVSPGETMGERLKNSRNKFEPVFYQKIWDAHKVRNSLVHEPGYEPPYYVVTESIETLRKALVNLGAKL